MKHCLHRSPDPRCDGYRKPDTSHSYWALMSGRYDGHEDVDEKPRYVVERKMAYVCCRCHEPLDNSRLAFLRGCDVRPAERAVEELTKEAKP